MIYEEINMIYTVSSMIYRHQYDFGRKRFTVNGMIYEEINMIYSFQYDL
jgi:hypothetical protein